MAPNTTTDNHGTRITCAAFPGSLFGGHASDITVQPGGYAPDDTETRQ